MRERLVAAFALVTLLVLVVFTLARAYALENTVTHSTQQQADRTVLVLAAVLAERGTAPVTTGYLRGFLDEAERVEYVDPAGRRVTAEVPGFADGAGESDVVASAATPGGGRVTLRRAGAWVDDQVDDGLLPLVLFGVGLVLLAAALGFLAARMLSRPFSELAGHATALGRGRFDLEVPRYAVPEADTIGRALQTSAGQLRDMLRRERDFASNASHQLRTPLTALRLELEDLAINRELSPEAADHLHRGLGELDRLTDSVTHLLARSRGARLDRLAGVDVARLAEEAVRRVERDAARAGREVAAVAGGPATVHLPPGPIDALLDVLLQRALADGEGPVVVEVGDDGDHVWLRVDPGDGTPAAVELADALGGRLAREADRGGVSVLLPRG